LAQFGKLMVVSALELPFHRVYQGLDVLVFFGDLEPLDKHVQYLEEVLLGYLLKVLALAICAVEVVGDLVGISPQR
jgi:hypothetical protein